MLIATGSCCCGGGLKVYVGWAGDATIYEIDPVAQTYQVLAIYAGATRRTYDIACDRNTGRIYIAASSGGAAGDVFCLASDGSTVWSSNPGENVFGVAVSKAGYVYAVTAAGSGNGKVRKYQASDGTEITTGGWPYAPGGGADYRCICVDQNDNVYVGGDNTARTVRALSLDSTGTLRWTSNVSNVALALEGTSQWVTGIGVNALGGQVVCSRVIDTTKTVKSHYHLNAATGVVTGSFKDVSPSNGINNVGKGQNCVYDSLGNSYTTQLTNSTNRYTVLQNLGQYYRLPVARTAFSIAVSLAGDQFIVMEVPGTESEFISILGGWSLNLPTTVLASIETSDGKIGAFGV